MENNDKKRRGLIKKIKTSPTLTISFSCVSSHKTDVKFICNLVKSRGLSSRVFQLSMYILQCLLLLRAENFGSYHTI